MHATLKGSDCAACGAKWPYSHCPAGCGTEIELSAAKAIIERMLPRRDNLTADELIRRELNNE